MGTRENKNAKTANLPNPRKFKPAKIRARTVHIQVIPSLEGELHIPLSPTLPPTVPLLSLGVKTGTGFCYVS